GRFGTNSDKNDDDLLGFWQQSEVFRCTDGCQALVKKMVAKLADLKEKYRFTLLTDTKVTEINVGDSNVTLQWNASTAASKANPKHAFDYVILATPPTVWDLIAIKPDHPKDIMGPLQQGPAVKFFSDLKKRFWIDEKAAPSGIASDIGMIWEGTDNQTQVGNQGIVLSVFNGGQTTAGRDESYFKNHLRDLYRGGGYNKALKNPRLVSWHKEPYIRTGYSCPKIGHIFTIAPKLQEPIHHRLYLAGEHTETNFFGFMEGALRSGRRAAQAVIDKICPAIT
ncbi:MAG TPA: FAD-dependent oxidoreductase, partial [Candidatus Angelobacter sp.]|nr:FAD-dependent oxidoreductase [Candidatus Angelobacter sp.]